MPLVTSETTFVTAEVSSLGADGKSLVANSACAEGVEFAYPPFPSNWVSSACSASELVTSVCDSLLCSGGPHAPTFTSVDTDDVCFRQLGPKVWEVGYFIKKCATGGTTSGTGQYLFALPPEVPAIDTSTSFQQSSTGECALNVAGDANHLLHVNRIDAQGIARNGVSTATAILPNVWDSTHVRIAVGALKTAEDNNAVGTVKWFSASSAPAGWLVADGRELSRLGYAALFAVIGTTYGAGDGSTTFQIPDLRGEFIRGWDEAGGTAHGCDTGRVFGSSQGFAIERILGTICGISETFACTASESSTSALYRSSTNPVRDKTPSGTDCSRAGTLKFDSARSVSSSTETRPTNVAMLPCIKHSGNSNDPGFISSGFFSADGDTNVVYNFAFQYTSV